MAKRCRKSNRGISVSNPLLAQSQLSDMAENITNNKYELTSDDLALIAGYLGAFGSIIALASLIKANQEKAEEEQKKDEQKDEPLNTEQIDEVVLASIKRLKQRKKL
ncbi:hypothetical protein MH117_15790 [Paenibacillus sp. ACRRX]|uniref:hypothetical protein n=1 Tax=unclassified Paenibacillus TaxID=185978 RepID=UPI001EF6D295|nr:MULTISPECIES: hypothetical protein [unclassified Paenibacillus]MCG7408879.1 hypothetical protein [Paenibacillus sp. ACRRX]MDK8182210.1 hypothetical protein [Paenibacillus sp. UMB4589-SE434]